MLLVTLDAQCHIRKLPQQNVSLKSCISLFCSRMPGVSPLSRRSLPDVASRTECYHVNWLKFGDLWRLDICSWQKLTLGKKEIILQCCLFKGLFQAAELRKSQQNLSNEPNRLLLLRLGATNDKLQRSHLWPRMRHNQSEELFSEIVCICNYKWVIMPKHGKGFCLYGSLF